MRILKIIVDEIPENCIDCKAYACRLPECANSDKIKKPFWTKRHPKCPLQLEELKVTITGRD